MGYAYPNMAYKDYLKLMKEAKEEQNSFQTKDIATMLRIIENYHVDLAFINRIKGLASVVGSYSNGFELTSQEINEKINPLVKKCEEKLDEIRNQENSDTLKKTIEDFDPSMSANKLLALKIAVDQSLTYDCKRRIFEMQDAILDMLNKIDEWMKNEVFLPAKVTFYLDDRRKEREAKERD